MAQDDPYASIAKPVNDPYSSLAGGEPAVAPQKSNWQSNTEPQETGNPISNAIHNIGGRAASALVSPILHPIDALKSLGQTMIQPPYKTALGMSQEYMKSGHPLENVLGDTIGGILQGRLTGGAIKSLAMAGGPIKSAGAALDNAVIGAPGKAFRFGANPGSAISENRIIGTTPGALASQVEEGIPSAAAEHRDIIMKSQGGKKINTGPLLSEPFDTRMAAGTDPRTGASSPAQIGAASRTLRQLTHVPDEQNGQATPNLRDPNLSPLEATQLKSNLYPRINYDSPSRYSMANDSLRSAAHNLKAAVDSAVPEQVQAGQRLHNMMSAKDILEPSARGQKIRLDKSGLIDRAATLAGTSGAAGLDMAGSGLKRLIDAPPLVPIINVPKKQIKKDGNEEDE